MGFGRNCLISHTLPQKVLPMRRYFALYTVALAAALGLLGCASGPPLAPVDLTAPGWRMREGQAIWKPGADAPELVGDIVLATYSTGSYVRFSKTLPIVNARWEGDRWEAEFPPQNKRYSGGGNPPKRIAWFNLLKGMEGRELPEDWIFSEGADGSALLVNHKTGERLEVHFSK